MKGQQKEKGKKHTRCLRGMTMREGEYRGGESKGGEEAGGEEVLRRRENEMRRKKDDEERKAKGKQQRVRGVFCIFTMMDDSVD